MLIVQSLGKTFDDFDRGPFTAVDRISFSVHEGEVFGLLGPNGAGKTTTLRMLSTLLAPTTGTATVNGFDLVREASRVRNQIGFISATTGIYERLTARETVEFFGRLNGIDGAELARRIDAIFTRLDMLGMADTLGVKMSTGMRQKVSIARALVHDPPVLIFDEATNGLDVAAARALRQTVAELRSEGKCIIFSTHILRDAEKLCDRVAIIHRGQILVSGTLAELLAGGEHEDLEALFVALTQADAKAAG